MKKMFNIAVVGLMALCLMGMDAFARGCGGCRSGGGFSSGRSSYSSSRNYSSGSKSYSTKKPSTGTYKSKPKATTSVKKSAGGFGKTKIDKNSASYKKTNSMISKNFGTSNKKFNNVAEAKKDLSSRMANKTYSYKDPKVAMVNRPSYIPTSYQGHTTVYVGGHYGYYNPMGSFIAYTAANMMITDAMMHSYAPNAYNSHVVVHHSAGDVVVWTIVGFFVIVGLIGLIVALCE